MQDSVRFLDGRKPQTFPLIHVQKNLYAFKRIKQQSPYKKEDKAIFLYGSGKNERSNINKEELHYFKKLDSDLLEAHVRQIEKLKEEEQVLFDLEEQNERFN